MLKISSYPKTLFGNFNLSASFFNLEETPYGVPLKLKKTIFNHNLNHRKIFNRMPINDIKVQVHNLFGFFIHCQVIFTSNVEGNLVENSGLKVCITLNLLIKL